MSKKDAFYFPHDSNAKDDPKCVLLIEQLGMEGYGIYWMLIETLRDQPDYTYPTALLPALARRYNTTPEKVKTVVFNYGLFVVKNDTIFFSQSLVDRMIPMEQKKAQARLAGLKSAEKRASQSNGCNGRSTDIQQALNDRSTKRKEKTRKDESKDKEISLSRCKEKPNKSVFLAPSIDEIEKYFSTIGGIRDDAESFCDHFTANGWRVSGKSPMRDWKAAARNWMRRKPDFKTTPHQPTTKPVTLTL